MSPANHRPTVRQGCTRLHAATAVFLALTAFVVALGGAGCTTSAPVDASAITLAATLPLSTAESAVGIAWQEGYARAVAEVNRDGGIRLTATGQRVRVLLQVRDDGGETEKAQQLAEELFASGVHALLATPNALRMAAQAAVARRYARPYVVPAPFGPDLRATDRPWLFVAPKDGGSDEERAYLTARAALAGFEATPTLDAEAIRRTFRDIETGERGRD